MGDTDVFGNNVGVTKVKAYMVFILAFTAITNIVVSSTVSCPLGYLCDGFIAEVYWVDVVSFG